MFIWFPNLPPGDCLPGRNLFIQSLNLPPGDCLPELQPVFQPTLKGTATLMITMFYMKDLNKP